MGLIKLIIPDDVHQRLKSEAALAKRTLTAHCVIKLSGELGGLPCNSGDLGHTGVYAGIDRSPAPHKPCSVYGALTGHQKWCKA